MVHVRDYIFIATRDRALFRYSLLRATSQGATDRASRNNFVNENVVRLLKMNAPGVNVLVVQGASRMFYLREHLFPKGDVIPIPDLKNVKCCTVYPNGNYLAVADPQNLYLFGLTQDGSLVLQKKVQHSMKGIVNLVASGNALLMYDNK